LAIIIPKTITKRTLWSEKGYDCKSYFCGNRDKDPISYLCIWILQNFGNKETLLNFLVSNYYPHFQTIIDQQRIFNEIKAKNDGFFKIQKFGFYGE
jgi:hypothetical protein